MPPSNDAAAGDFDSQVFLLTTHQGVFYIHIGEVKERIAVRFLIRSDDQRIDAQGVGVGRRLGLFDQYAEDAPLLNIQRGPRAM